MDQFVAPGETCAYAVGRRAPNTKGHLQVDRWCLDNFDKLIIGLGSRYEAGTSRHPLLASLREKMALWSLREAGVDLRRVRVVHLEDFGNWEAWWNHITSIPWMDKVTHFITGNEEEILNEISARNMTLPFEIINPEKEDLGAFRFMYHATDLRQAIAAGDYKKFTMLAASGTTALMGHVGGFTGLRRALADSGTRFIAGRQAVDAVVTIDLIGQDRLILTGRRKKGDFAGCLALPGGGIDTYESPMDACLRELMEETGLAFTVYDRVLEPAHLGIAQSLCTMRSLGLFSHADPAIAGTKGGSVEGYHIPVDVPVSRLEHLLASNSDLDEVCFRPEREVLVSGLAFGQMDIVRAAGFCLG